MKVHRLFRNEVNRTDGDNLLVIEKEDVLDIEGVLQSNFCSSNLLSILTYLPC